MFRKGDKIKFRISGDRLESTYEYEESKQMARELCVDVAQRLTIPVNEGTVVDNSTATKVAATYKDDKGLVGMLYFDIDQVILVERKEEVVNNYEIY